MPQTEEKPINETLIVDDELWEALIKSTGGSAALCYQCGVCTAACPWGLVRQESLSVRSLMRLAQLGIRNRDSSLWLCTTCAQCQFYCPRGVDIVEVFRGLRHLAWERRKTMEGLPSVLWSVFWNNNPWSQPPSTRSDWAKKLNLPIFDSEMHEVLLYIGCTSSYDRRAQKIALSLTNLLDMAGIKFGFLGDEEPCCGEAVLSLGHRPYFQEIAQKNAQFFQDHGVTKLVSISPHCFDVFANHYPRMDEDFQPLHYTQYLAELHTEGRLKFPQNLQTRITFQDPCYLGRHNDEYDAPRLILENLPGVDFVEMKNHGADSLCCGGGGGRMWLETAPGERFSDLRVEQAIQTGAQMLVTACPFCAVCLEDSLKVLEIDNLKVMDLAELIMLTQVDHGEMPSW